METVQQQAEDPALLKMRANVLAHFDIQGKRGIEIGPLYRPLVEKTSGEIYYVDHCSTEELRTKYIGHQHVHPDKIVPVDFIWNDRPLAETAAEVCPVDYIVASHVIEHVPDLIGWLKEMHDSLRDGGTLVLIVPDKRFTFDVCRRTSSYEEVNSGYQEKRRRPGLRTIMDCFSNMVKADCYSLWADYRITGDLPFFYGPEYLTLAANHYTEGRYIDVHCWVFTPWSFLALLHRINVETSLGFDLEFFDTTHENDLEFYVRLIRTSHPKTDWLKEAAKAEATAIWPKNR